MNMYKLQGDTCQQWCIFKFHILAIIFLVIIIPSGAIPNTNNYFSTANFAYGQTNQTNSNNANPLNVQNIPVEKSM